MADYILLRNSDDHILEEADSTRFRKTGVPPVLKPEKGIRWLELVVVNPAQEDGRIKEGPTVEITETTYTRTWTVRNRTTTEKNTDKSNIADSHFSGSKLLIMALNDGSFIPGSNYTQEQIKAKLKAKI